MFVAAIEAIAGITVIIILWRAFQYYRRVSVEDILDMAIVSRFHFEEPKKMKRRRFFQRLFMRVVSLRLPIR